MLTVGGAWVSIFEETGGGQSAVAHDRSLELFFDRHEVIARFVALINDDPPPRKVLYLYGLGGNGKSLLLRYLAARCCLRLPPPEWSRIRRLPTGELAAALGSASKTAQVPVARIDFGARPVGENRPQECFSALFMIKQQLARHHIITPRFDFAAVTYLHKMGFDLDRRLPELFPASELGIALGLADAFLPIQLMRVSQDMFDALDRRLDDARLTRPAVCCSARPASHGPRASTPATWPRWCAPAARQTPPPLGLAEPLTDRELEVLRLLADGKSNQAIAHELVVAFDTVKKHVSHVLGKLGAANRTEAVARARGQGLIPSTRPDPVAPSW